MVPDGGRLALPDVRYLVAAAALRSGSDCAPSGVVHDPHPSQSPAHGHRPGSAHRYPGPRCRRRADRPGAGPAGDRRAHRWRAARRGDARRARVCRHRLRAGSLGPPRPGAAGARGPAAAPGLPTSRVVRGCGHAPAPGRPAGLPGRPQHGAHHRRLGPERVARAGAVQQRIHRRGRRGRGGVHVCCPGGAIHPGDAWSGGRQRVQPGRAS